MTGVQTCALPISTLSLAAVPIACSNAAFSAVASNGVAPDATSTSAILTVGAAPMAPTISSQPADATVVPGATATFLATATGVPTPTAQWQQSGDAGVTWTNIVGATAATYTTPTTAPADTGRRYLVIFTNASGSATSNGATLTDRKSHV